MPTDNPQRLLDCDQLREILPQRHPFLMVDRVLIQAKNQAVGIKNVTMDEPCFQGHFPGHPLLPGVFMLEAMIQTGGVLIHQTAGLPSGMAFLLSIDKAKFRRPVFPGDQLKIDTTLLRFRSGTARLRAAASVRDEPVGQATFTIGIRDNFRPQLRPTAFAPPLCHESLAPTPIPIMDIHEIMRIIPHRYPFLMVDAILSQFDNRIIALKNITGNEPFFNGHFPEYAVMPGTLLVEAMAQAGAVYMLNLPQYRGKTGYFISMEGARFRHPVRPGDRLILDLELTANRPRVGRGYGRIFVGSTKAAEARFSFVITDPLPGKTAAQKTI